MLGYRVVLLVAAGLAFAPEARAAGVPVSLPIGEKTPDTQFQLSGPADVAEFKIKLAAGTDIFVGIETYERLDLKVFDQNGKLLKSHVVTGNTDASPQEGVEVHPTVTGTYTVRVSGDPQGSVDYPTDVAIWAYPGCRGGPATGCTIAPGNTKSASFAGWNDDDAYAIKGATAGRGYAATVQVTTPGDYLYGTDLRLVDGSGKVLQSVTTGNSAERRNNATLKFVLPKGGPFYLQEHPHPISSFEIRATYTLSLKQQ